MTEPYKHCLKCAKRNYCPGRVTRICLEGEKDDKGRKIKI